MALVRRRKKARRARGAAGLAMKAARQNWYWALR